MFWVPILMVAGAVGWFRDVLPHEAHDVVPCGRNCTGGRDVAAQSGAFRDIAAELPRAWLPLEIYPVSAGIKGGLAGSRCHGRVGDAVRAPEPGSIWYPINLLAARLFPSRGDGEHASNSPHFISMPSSLPSPIHLLTSLLVGVLYGAMLPMLPRRPILLGGFIAPLHVVRLAAQRASGSSIRCSINGSTGCGSCCRRWDSESSRASVVSRQERVRTWQRLPLAVRAGIEAPGDDARTPRGST